MKQVKMTVRQKKVMISCLLFCSSILSRYYWNVKNETIFDRQLTWNKIYFSKKMNDKIIFLCVIYVVWRQVTYFKRMDCSVADCKLKKMKKSRRNLFFLRKKFIQFFLTKKTIWINVKKIMKNVLYLQWKNFMRRKTPWKIFLH